MKSTISETRSQAPTLAKVLEAAYRAIDESEAIFGAIARMDDELDTEREFRNAIKGHIDLDLIDVPEEEDEVKDGELRVSCLEAQAARQQSEIAELRRQNDALARLVERQVAEIAILKRAGGQL